MKATLIAVLILLAMVSGAVLFAQAPVVRITPDKLKWQSNPEDLGFSQAIVEGDPAKPGIYYSGEVSSWSDEQASLSRRNALRNSDQRNLVYR